MFHRSCWRVFLLDVSSSITEINYQPSFSIGRNRSLKLTLHECCTALVDASFSWMLDYDLQKPKYVRSKIGPNGKPGRAHEVGVVWVMLVVVFFEIIYQIYNILPKFHLSALL